MQAAMAGGGDTYIRSHTDAVSKRETLVKLRAPLQTPL